MGRPFQEKFADIKWEVNEEHVFYYISERLFIHVEAIGEKLTPLE